MCNKCVKAVKTYSNDISAPHGTLLGYYAAIAMLLPRKQIVITW